MDIAYKAKNLLEKLDSLISDKDDSRKGKLETIIREIESCANEADHAAGGLEGIASNCQYHASAGDMIDEARGGLEKAFYHADTEADNLHKLAKQLRNRAQKGKEAIQRQAVAKSNSRYEDTGRQHYASANGFTSGYNPGGSSGRSYKYMKANIGQGCYRTQ